MSRRGENIYKRKDGRWEGRYIKSRDLNHKAIYGYLYGKSYSEVKDKLRNIKHINSVSNENSTLFSNVVYEWLSNRKLNVKESTLSHYKSVVDNHILPLLGGYESSAISTERIQVYLSQLIENRYSAKTVNDILVIIKNIFRFARSNGVQVLCNLDIITIKEKKTEIKTLSKAEQNILSNYLVDNINNRNLGILLSLYTGIRIGELCALRWSDIDLAERTLKVNKTMIRIQNISTDMIHNKTKVIISEPKSNDSCRVIPIPNFIFNLVVKFVDCKDAFILTASADKYLEPRAMQYYFKSVLNKCNIEDINFHALRHTFATRCVENGFEIKSLSEILGHSSVKITLERYVHSSMELKRENMNKLKFISA